MTEEPNTARVEFEEGHARATVQIRPQDVLYLQPERILRELPASPRVTRRSECIAENQPRGAFHPRS